MYINHITLNTGYLARTQRADVPPEVTALLAPWLQGIANSGQAHPLPVPELAHISAQAFVQDGGLAVTVSAPVGPHSPGRPHAGAVAPLVTFGVAQRSRQGAALWALLIRAFPVKQGLQQPEAPWLAVALHPSAAAYTGALDWLGDFERCIAWAWITRNPVLGAVQ